MVTSHLWDGAGDERMNPGATKGNDVISASMVSAAHWTLALSSLAADIEVTGNGQVGREAAETGGCGECQSGPGELWFTLSAISAHGAACETRGNSSKEVGNGWGRKAALQFWPSGER